MYRDWRRQAGGTLLLPVGPFASLPSTRVNSDLTYSSGTTLPASTRLAPLRYKNFTLSNGVFYGDASGYGGHVYIWCDTFTLTDANIDVSGQNGSDGYFDGGSTWIGGNGGGGETGAGGGGAGDGTANASGGVGGFATYESGGQSGSIIDDLLTGNYYAGSGGSGTAIDDGYSYGVTGGSSYSTASGYLGGAAGNGGISYTGGDGAAGGGGGGGGTIVIVCREFVATGASNYLNSYGGTSGGGVGYGDYGESGGGGSILLWTQKLNFPTISAIASGGGGIYNGSDGSIRLYEVASNYSILNTFTAIDSSYQWDHT